MTNPIGGSEHISRYRALGEFDNLIREANRARRALRELREEESRLNAQSISEDRRVEASRSQRARSETNSATSVNRAMAELSRNRQAAGKAGEENAKEFTMRFGIQVETEAKKLSNTTLARMTRALETMFRDSGNRSGDNFISGMTSRLTKLNSILNNLGLDSLDLDVSIDDARQSIRALEYELNQLGHSTATPEVRIETNRALTNLRAIQKLFKDEVAEDIIRESKRVREELVKLDSLPSGRAFKFWALTALSDMTRVFNEADRGSSIFNRLRSAISASGGGSGGTNFVRSFISSFDSLSETSSRLLQRLGRVSGELYRMPGIIGILVSALPALVAGLGSLAGGIGTLSSGLGALSGFLAAGPGLFAAFTGGVGAAVIGISGLKDTFKAAAKAEQERAVVQEQARLGTEKALTATQKYNLLLKELNPATQSMIKQIMSFSDEWHNLSEAIGERFFKEVVDDMQRLNKLFPVAENFFGRSASALGDVAEAGIKMLSSGPWRRDFAIIARNNADVIKDMGLAGLSLANVFRNIAIAAGPFTSWVTGAIKEGAKAFADWSAQARSNGTIQDFLLETTESGQILWQILKNLGNVIKSFFQSTVDEGQRYLSILEDITGSWADVAEAQERANSPLRMWINDIRPVLSSLGALIKAIAVGIVGLATDQKSLQTMIDLLDSLRTDVLPPVLAILHQLNESGIAVTVVRAFGDFLTAIADFLESGATNALSVFVTVLAHFAELIFSFASLPVVSDILGGLASSLAAIAAVSIVARFTGLFKLWDFFTWMSRNRGNLSGAFADAARGVAGLQTTGQAVPSVATNVPSTISRTVGSEVLGAQARATSQVGQASASAAGQTSTFARALQGVRTAGGTARGALTGLTGFLGGPWGVALVAATTLIGVVTNKLIDNKQEAQDTKNAFLALKGAYDELSAGNSKGVEDLAATDSKFRDIVDSARNYGITLRDVSGALNNQEQSLTRFNGQINAQISSLTAARDQQVAYAKSQGDTTGAFNEGIAAVQRQIDAAEAYKKQVNDVAAANGVVAQSTGFAADATRTYEERLAGLTQQQVDNAVQSGNLQAQIMSLSSALDTMSSATATSQDRSKALADIINYQTGAAETANEAAENWSNQLLTLQDSIKANGSSLSLHSREGLRNRDALEAAAKASRQLYLEDIAAGVPMDQAIKRHQKRIRELEKEAEKGKFNKTVTRELIDAYGDVPETVSTNITTDDKGFQQVFADLKKLQIIQTALQQGKSVKDAEQIWVNESSFMYQRPPKGGGDGYGAPGYASGGPVWGEGTRTSDSIRAWLSNGEFVQPTDAVDYYGIPVMEALRTRKLDKAVIKEALPDDNTNQFSSGGVAHSHNCPVCSSGGHKFARGGQVRPTWPFEVDPSNTKIDKDWANNVGGMLGGAGGSGGWQWQMRVLRQRFPGLPLISGPRPGARTLSGNRSYHSMGRAVDLPPRRDVAEWIRATYGAKTKELITPYNDLNLWNGKPHRYTGAVWNQHNFPGGNAHDHWAFNQGGLIDLMNMLGMDGLNTNTTTSLPTTPRTLSPAASSVVNNTTENGTTFGDVIINNPQAERAGDSVRNALYRTMYLI